MGTGWAGDGGFRGGDGDGDGVPAGSCECAGEEPGTDGVGVRVTICESHDEPRNRSPVGGHEGPRIT
jgi:hypothetical protein